MQPTQRWAASRTVGWVVVGSLVLAALVAIGSILRGEFSDNDWKAIGTSIGFGVFTATGSAGAQLREKEPERLPALSLGTILVSALSFVLLLVELWGGDSEGLVRSFATTAIASLAASHACLSIVASRPTDGSTVDSVRAASVVLSVTSSLLGILAATGLVDHPGSGYWRFVAVLVVLLLLATTLVPILRRLEQTQPATQPAARTVTPTPAPRPLNTPSAGTAAPLPFTTEVLATADRIEALTTGNEAVHDELTRLRELARFYG